METTEKLNIYQKLLKIQKSVMGLGKDKKSFGYDYVTGTKVLEHIKPLMNELGLLLKQEVLSTTNVRMDYNTKNGSKTEILTQLDLKFTWIDCETGETDVNLFGANGQNDFEKGFGSALTYSERYFLLKYFHIATDEDDIDNPDRKTTQPVKQPLEPSTAVKVANMTNTPVAKELTAEELKKHQQAINLITQAVGIAGYYNSLAEDVKANKTIQGYLSARREAIKV